MIKVYGLQGEEVKHITENVILLLCTQSLVERYLRGWKKKSRYDEGQTVLGKQSGSLRKEGRRSEIFSFHNRKFSLQREGVTAKHIAAPSR